MKLFYFAMTMLFLSPIYSPLSQAAVCNDRSLNIDKLVTDAKGDMKGIDGALFINSMTDKLRSKFWDYNLNAYSKSDIFKGYSVALADAQGNLVSYAYDGLARTSCDRDQEQKFNLDTVAPWGSISKVITTTILMHYIQNSENNIRLDDRIVEYLPARWNVHSRLLNVTIKDVMQHKTGLVGNVSDANDPLKLRNRIETGDEFLIDDRTNTPARCQSPEMSYIASKNRWEYPSCYANINQGLLNVMFYYMVDKPNANLYDSFRDNLVNLNHITEAEYDIDVVYNAEEYYMDTSANLLRSTLGINATCNMKSYVGTGSNYSLPFESVDSESGETPSDHTYGCAQGGWMMSTRDMLKYLHGISQTSRLISRATYNNITNPNDLLTIGARSIDGGNVFQHNGFVDKTSAHFAIYPTGHVSAVIANSNNSDIAVKNILNGKIIDSYIEARISGLERVYKVLPALNATLLDDWPTTIGSIQN